MQTLEVTCVGWRGADAWSSLLYYTAGPLEVGPRMAFPIVHASPDLASCLARPSPAPPYSCCGLAPRCCPLPRLTLTSSLVSDAARGSVPAAGGWRQDVPRIMPLPVEDAKKKSSKNGKDEEAPPPPEVGVFVAGPLTYASMGGLRSRVILRESG